LNGLTKGDYLIVYQAEFTEEHPMRKLIICVYTDFGVVLNRVTNKHYSANILEELSESIA